MPDYAKRVKEFMSKAQTTSLVHHYSNIGTRDFDFNVAEFPYQIFDSVSPETPTPMYSRVRNLVEKAEDSYFRPKGYNELKHRFDKIQNDNAPADILVHFRRRLSQDRTTGVFDYQVKAQFFNGEKNLSTREYYQRHHPNAPDEIRALKREAIARREKEASELIQSQAYKNLEKQLQKLMNLPKFRPRMYTTDKLSVKSDPRLLINTVNNLKKALQRRNTSEAPIGRGTSDFFANILRRGEG